MTERAGIPLGTNPVSRAAITARDIAPSRSHGARTETAEKVFWQGAPGGNARALAKTTFGKAPSVGRRFTDALQHLETQCSAYAHEGKMAEALRVAESIPHAGDRVRVILRIALYAQRHRPEEYRSEPLYEAALRAALEIFDIQESDMRLQLIAILSSDEGLHDIALRAADAIAMPRTRGMAHAHIGMGLAKEGRLKDAERLASRIDDPFARSLAFMTIGKARPSLDRRALLSAEMIVEAADRDEAFAMLAADLADRRRYAEAFAIAARLKRPEMRVRIYLVEVLRASVEHGDKAVSQEILRRATAAAAVIVEPTARAKTQADVQLAQKAIEACR